MSHPFTLLITACGGSFIPDLIDHIRDWSKGECRIVAVDIKENAVGYHMADDFATVPYATDPTYIHVLLELCKRHSVDVIVPLSDQEVDVISKFKGDMEAAGHKVMAPSVAMVKTAGHKGKMLDHLRLCGLETPDYYRPKCLEELEDACNLLRFPEMPIVCKPASGQGGRGFRIIREDFSEFDEIFGRKREVSISLPRLKRVLEAADEFPDIVLMDYLDGADFSIDVLYHGSRVARCVSQEKLFDNEGNVAAIQMRQEKKINVLAGQIGECFKFDCVVNIDAAARLNDGKILPYEINARPSALISGTSPAGASLFLEGVYHVLGLPYKMPPLNLNGQIQYLNRGLKRFC